MTAGVSIFGLEYSDNGEIGPMRERQMNDNMDAAPRDGTVINLRLSDGDKTSGRFEAPAGSLGYWVGMDGRVLTPQPCAWSNITS